MRTRTRRTAIAAVSALALVAAACGSDDESDSESDEAAEEASDAADDDADEAVDEPDDAMDEEGEEAVEDDEAPDAGSPALDPLRIGIVAPSASNDLAFSQSIVDSVNRLDESLVEEIAITDGTFVVEDAAAAIRGYADDGFDLVIAHGSQFGGPLEEIAPDFPETSFAWGTSSDTFGLDNVFAYTTRADEGGYVNGVMAAQLTESGTIGVVGPIEVGDAQLYVDGFVAGAEATAPDVTVNVNYIESFSDVALAAEAATAFVSNDADVLTGTAQMVGGTAAISTMRRRSSSSGAPAARPSRILPSNSVAHAGRTS